MYGCGVLRMFSPTVSLCFHLRAIEIAFVGCCWITYKVRDGELKELAAYELMSANDALERNLDRCAPYCGVLYQCVDSIVRAVYIALGSYFRYR